MRTSILFLFGLFCLLGHAHATENSSEEYSIFGLSFGMPVGKLQKSQYFQCEKRFVGYMCTAQFAQFGIQDVRYIENIYTYFHGEKLALITVQSGAMIDQSRLEQEAGKVYDYLVKVLDLENQQWVDFKPQVNVTQSYYAARNWRGINMVFKIFDKRTIDAYSAAFQKSLEEKKADTETRAKNQLKDFNL